MNYYNVKVQINKLIHSKSLLRSNHLLLYIRYQSSVILCTDSIKLWKSNNKNNNHHHLFDCSGLTFGSDFNGVLDRPVRWTNGQIKKSALSYPELINFTWNSILWNLPKLRKVSIKTLQALWKMRADFWPPLHVD